MCGRYVQAKTTLELAEVFQAAPVAAEPETQPSWNVAPTMSMPVVVRREERQLRVMRWGLVPSWAKDPSIGSRLINARIETLTAKSAFRTAVSRRRCLIPADGWYEWTELLPAGDGRRRKQPVWLSLRDGGPLAFAGVYEHWKDRADPDASWISSYTIVTTTAIDELGHGHDRSPVPVAPGRWEAWLDPALTDGAAAVSLLDPPAHELVVARPVSTAVNSVRNDGPGLIEPVP